MLQALEAVQASSNKQPQPSEQPWESHLLDEAKQVQWHHSCLLPSC